MVENPIILLKWDYPSEKERVNDVLRKRTFPSMTPGPWTGTVTHIDYDEEFGTMTEKVVQDPWTGVGDE